MLGLANAVGLVDQSSRRLTRLQQSVFNLVFFPFTTSHLLGRLNQHHQLLVVKLV
jgi:hypothetical protein